MTYKFELSQEDSELLTVTLGYAAGAANERGDKKRFASIIRLANTIHAGRPNWTPYEVSSTSTGDDEGAQAGTRLQDS